MFNMILKSDNIPKFGYEVTLTSLRAETETMLLALKKAV